MRKINNLRVVKLSILELFNIFTAKLAESQFTKIAFYRCTFLILPLN